MIAKHGVFEEGIRQITLFVKIECSSVRSSHGILLYIYLQKERAEKVTTSLLLFIYVETFYASLEQTIIFSFALLSCVLNKIIWFYQLG